MNNILLKNKSAQVKFMQNNEKLLIGCKINYSKVALPPIKSDDRSLLICHLRLEMIIFIVMMEKNAQKTCRIRKASKKYQSV